MERRALSLGITNLLWVVHAGTTLWAHAGQTTEYRCRLRHEALATTRADEAKSEYADDADGEKGQDGHPKVVLQPGMRPPTACQYSDGHQPQPKKTKPSIESVSDRQKE